ncbi:MAG: type II toxin-antitoxin system RelB/DinJ family antitoxin [Oscillospiraceae bacterium]|jgi:DNA-damage-inducible protein J|nr:type II toxin-antitoxin system RelB/DinJ family antitoxin [Oscillospiraceae bacterium]
MSQTTLNVRMDEEVKKGLEKFCYEVGLNVSVAVNMFAKAVVREQRLPFEVALNVPNEETRRAIDDVANRRGLSRPFNSVAELMESLNADD